MSRRRASYRPYQPADSAAFLASMYGDARPDDPRDATAVPEPACPNPWIDGLVALAQGIAGAAIVIAAWHALAWWLGLLL